MQINLNMKTISQIIAILGIILGIIGGMDTMRLSILSSDIIFNGILALIMNLLAIIGILVFNKNMKIGSIQFIISGIGLIIAIYMYGLYGGICLIFAGIMGIITLIESKEEQEEDNKLFLLPAITIVIIILALFGPVVIEALDEVIDSTSNSDAITISNLNSEISSSNGYVSGDFKGNLETKKEFEFLTVQVEFFDDNNVSLAKNTAFLQSNVQPGGYEFSAFFYGSKMPSKAVIEVSSDSNKDPIYTQNVTIN